MYNSTLLHLSRITGAQLLGDPNAIARSVSTDTRKSGDTGETVFVALRGPNHDGHSYLQDAVAMGYRSFLVNGVPEGLSSHNDLNWLIVSDTLEALQTIAADFRKSLKGTVLAITGSNGKTIVKEWLAQVVSRFLTTGKSPRSYNSQLGVPLSILGLDPSNALNILEAGISAPGEMSKLEAMIKPDWGLLTTIGEAHQEHFDNLEQKLEEKLVLFKGCSRIFHCGNQLVVSERIRSTFPNAKVISWGHSGLQDLLISSELTTGPETRLTGVYKGIQMSITIPLTDRFSIDNAIFVWLVALELGLPPDQIGEALRFLEPMRMRMEQKGGINGCTLINDFYNSDVAAFSMAVDLLLQQTHQEKKSIIFSDILQTGIPEAQLYSVISRLLSSRNLHRLYGIGPAVCRNRELFTQPISTWNSTQEFINQLDPDSFRDEAVLLKGARAFRFEEISRLLEARTHATTLEIRMEDVRHNLNQYRQILSPGTGIMVMIKAFSYGSGGVEIARFLANERVDYLGVAFTDEGMEIRKAGIRTPIMVMNPDFRQSDLMIEYQLEPEIFNWSGLTSFVRTLNEMAAEPTGIHIKIDTGMHRLGFQPEEAEKVARFLSNQNLVRVRTVFSHLSASENPDADPLTRRQIKRLEDSARIISDHLKYPVRKHILNTSGIGRFPDAHFDLVRLGIGLYGYGGGELPLKPVATLKTRISQIHEVPAGDTVGYGILTRLSQDSRIAVIPIGYADGIDRRLGGGRYQMIIKGTPVPTIGHICMDMTLLDITGTDAAEGDEVTVFSPEKPVTEMAEILQTIPYEILTSIPLRVRRVYFFD